MLYLLGDTCIEECPQYYDIGEDGMSCIRVDETLIPFVFLLMTALWALLIFFGWCFNRKTRFFSSFIAGLAIIVFLAWIAIIILFVRDEHY